MNPIYRNTFMRVWIDAMANGYASPDARELAEIEAQDALKKEREKAHEREKSRELATVEAE